MKRTLTRVVTLVAAVGLVAAMSSTALATPPDESGVVVRGPSSSGFLYDGDGVIVLTGPPIEQGCFGEGFPSPDWSFIMPGNGSRHEHLSFGDSPIHVYEGEDVLTWIGEVCGEIAAGGEAPEPLATGVGTQTAHFRLDTQGVLHIHNSIVGPLTTADGRSAHINAFAKLTETNGVSDIHQLRVNYTG